MAEERRYWEPAIETMPLDKLRRLQEERLQEVVTRAYERTGLYRRKFDQAGVKPSDIDTLDDLRKLPFSEYLEDFCKTPVSEKLAVPIEEVKHVQTTSGTLSGFPQPVLFSRKDVEQDYLQGEAKARWTIGVRPADVVQVLTDFDCCLEGYSILGASILRLSAGRRNLDYQIRLAKEMNVTVIEHLPSMVLRYFERAEELGIDIRETKLRLVSGVGEGWAETYKKRIEARYGVPFRTFYGSVEGGFVAAQCEIGEQMHIFCDHSIVEVTDPEIGEVLGPGEEGEVVVTTLRNDAMPLIRYKMGDVARLLPYGPCPCGRTHPKLSMVKGRVSQIIRVKGKKILPIDVEEVVASTPGLGDEYQIVVDKAGELDRLKLKVEFKPEMKDLGALRSQVEEALHRDLGVDSEVELVPAGTLGRAVFKAQRIIASYGKK